MDSIDLHAHTSASDGVFTPTRVVQEARRIGLKAVGIADHDTVAGLDEALAAGDKLGVEVVVGCELSVLKEEKEFHILGYYIDYKKPKLLKILREFQREREKRSELIVDKLKELGWQINLKEVKKLAEGSIGRPHIARAVIENKNNRQRLKRKFGKIPTFSEFIGRYIVEGKKAYVARKFFASYEVITLIEELKGVSVFAHPDYDLPEERAHWLKDFVKEGLDGLEVYHYKKDDETTRNEIRRLKKLAKKYNLLETGGSDFHNPEGEAGVSLGFEGTFLKVPYTILERMKSYRERKYA